MNSINRDDILEILRDRLFLDVSSVDETTALFSSGLIDSFSLATLIVELEARGGFRMDPLDVNLENLDSIERMLRFVSAREND